MGGSRWGDTDVWGRPFDDPRGRMMGVAAPPPEMSLEDKTLRDLKRMSFLELAKREIYPPKKEVPLVEQANEEDRRAIALYVIASRDLEDFLDMLGEPETTPGVIRLLRGMCEIKHPKHDASDVELNELILKLVDRRTGSSLVRTAYDRLMSEED